MQVGFIGLGTMGSSMALNTIKGGHALVVHDINRDAAAPHLEAGATWADTPRAVAEASDVEARFPSSSSPHLRRTIETRSKTTSSFRAGAQPPTRNLDHRAGLRPRGSGSSLRYVRNDKAYPYSILMPT